MKIIRYDNPSITTTTTTISTAADYNDLTINVTDASSFSSGDILLLEEQGHERNEIVYIDSISDNTITLTSNITLPHIVGATVTLLNYDKYKITKSMDSTAGFKEVTTALLDYSNIHNSIEYTDDEDDASDNIYYKIYYVNSVLVTELLKDTYYKENNSSYISIDDYRGETNFTTSEVTDSEISRALASGVEWIQDNAYNKIQLRTTKIDNQYVLDLGIMFFTDWNADGVVDKNDMEVYEWDNQNNTRTSVSHLIIKVFEGQNKIMFSEDVPRTNKELVLDVKASFIKHGEQKYTIKTINKLIATNWLLMNVDVSKIKGGVSNWTAGGTSVSRDFSNIKDSIDKNYTEARRLLTQLLKTYSRKTKLRTTNSVLSSRVSSINSNYGIRLPSGQTVSRAIGGR